MIRISSNLKIILFNFIFFILIFIKLNNYFELIELNLSNEMKKIKTLIRQEKILILYSYFEKNEFYVKTFQYFLDFGVSENHNIDYILIIQGSKCSAQIPNYTNIETINRPNDCYDFGAYGKVIAKKGGKDFLLNYKAIIFLNPSAVGPILPKYWPDSLHWSEIFVSRLKNEVHAVATSIVCLPGDDFGGIGPKIEGYAFAASPLAVYLAYENQVFSCKKNKKDAILTGEYKFTEVLLDFSLNIDSLLLKYGNKDWRKIKNWNCNNNLHPTRYNGYENISVYPLEVVFHKPLWDNGNIVNILDEVYFQETIKYMEWKKNT